MKKYFLTSIITLISFNLSSQRLITISDFLSNHSSSIDNKKNKIEARMNNSSYELFKKSLLPNFSLSFNLPNYNRSISQIAQPDGTFTFGESNRANSSMRFSLSQPILFSGGSINLSNSFNRLDLFGSQNSTSYSASWLNFSLSQPLNFFNSYKWDKKIEKNKLKLNEVTNKQNKILIKEKVINYYFSLLQINSEEQILKDEINHLLKLKKVIGQLIKYKQRIPYDSLDLKLRIDYQKQKLANIREHKSLQLDIINTFFKPNNFSITTLDSLKRPSFSITKLNAKDFIDEYINIYELLKKNNLLPIQKNITKLRSENHYTANISAGFGLNNSADVISNILQNPNQSQNISISLSVPIFDFGKRKIEMEATIDQMELVKINLEQEKQKNINRIKFLCQDISFKSKKFFSQKERISFLKIKTEHQQKLLLSKKILLNTFFQTKNEYIQAHKQLIVLTKDIYNNYLELEKITLKTLSL